MRPQDRDISPFSERDLKLTYKQNVFVMMKFSDESQFSELELSIRYAVYKYDLFARLAKDRAYREDIWHNIVFYMQNCEYGIAVFEEINVREFNPNISMELGFMYALGRSCLLLKDKRMPRLPVDICGKIYKDFDTYDIRKTVTQRISEWCEHDLGFAKVQRTDLDLTIDGRIKSFHFQKPTTWAGDHLLVLREDWQGVKRYIVWDSKERRLLKYYREYGLGRIWDGPYPLNESDQQRVRLHLKIEDQ